MLRDACFLAHTWIEFLGFSGRFPSYFCVSELLVFIRAILVVSCVLFITVF